MVVLRVGKAEIAPMGSVEKFSATAPFNPHGGGVGSSRLGGCSGQLGTGGGVAGADSQLVAPNGLYVCGTCGLGGRSFDTNARKHAGFLSPVYKDTGIGVAPLIDTSRVVAGPVASVQRNRTVPVASDISTGESRVPFVDVTRTTTLG